MKKQTTATKSHCKRIISDKRGPWGCVSVRGEGGRRLGKDHVPAGKGKLRLAAILHVLGGHIDGIPLDDTHIAIGLDKVFLAIVDGLVAPHDDPVVGDLYLVHIIAGKDGRPWVVGLIDIEEAGSIDLDTAALLRLGKGAEEQEAQA